MNEHTHATSNRNSYIIIDEGVAIASYIVTVIITACMHVCIYRAPAAIELFSWPAVITSSLYHVIVALVQRPNVQTSTRLYDVASYVRLFH